MLRIPSMQIIGSLSSSNQTFAIRRPTQIVVGNRKGSKFTYTCLRAGRNTTVLIVVFVENKRGYTLTYVCASFLYRQLKEVANRMLNSFVIIDSEEDTVQPFATCEPQKIHQTTFSNPLANSWKDFQLQYCAIQIPFHWETSRENSLIKLVWFISFRKPRCVISFQIVFPSALNNDTVCNMMKTLIYKKYQRRIYHVFTTLHPSRYLNT